MKSPERPEGAGPERAGGRDSTRLRLARLAQGMSQQDLAALAGVSRQAVAGIEGGRWDPSLRVALALAGALDMAVEELFGPAAVAATVEATTLAPALAGQRVELATVGPLSVALPLVGDRALHAGFVPAAGIVVDPGRPTVLHRASVGLSVPARRSVAVAGCDPALPLLAEPLSRLNPAMGLVWWPCNSERALELAAAGLVHAAGMHLADDHAAVVALVERHFGALGAEVIGFAEWHEGLALAPHLDDRSFTLAGAVERNLRLVNREDGSEARGLLDQHLEQVGAVEKTGLAGYDTQVGGHLLVASSIAAGLGELGITTEPAALAYDLDFVPLAAERSHLVLSRPLLTTPEAQALLRALGSPHMRAQLGGLAGYDARPCGEAVCSL